jgi:S1 RNA binding domain
MEPSVVNVRHEEPTAKFPIRGKIQAVEDNGVLVDLGHGRKGFLPFTEMDENSYTVKDDNDDNSDDDNDDDDDDGMVVLKVGQLLDFIVKQSSKADIIPLRLPSPDVMAKHFIPPTARPSLQAISPGWLVKAKVEALARNGLCVALLGNIFRGAIEMSHLGGFWVSTTRHEDSDWKTLFRGKSDPIVSFTARVLAVDPATKMIRLTVLPHLMDLRPPPSDYLPKAGTVVQDATVIRLDPGVGALLALPNDDATGSKDMEVDDDNDEDDEMDDENIQDRAVANSSLLHDPLSLKQSYLDATKVRAVYVHISKAMDEREDGKTSEAAFAKAFAPSTKHSVRILR